MNIAYSFKNFTPAEKAGYQNYFETKIEKLSKVVDRLFNETTLDVRAERFVKKSAYNVALKLHGSRAQFFVSEDDHTLNEAIDLALDKLMAQLRRTKKNKKEG